MTKIECKKETACIKTSSWETEGERDGQEDSDAGRNRGLVVLDAVPAFGAGQLQKTLRPDKYAIRKAIAPEKRIECPGFGE